MDIQTHILIKYLKDFQQNKLQKTIPDTSEKESYYITKPHLESESLRFINNSAKLIQNKFNVNIALVYKLFKIGIYFQLN